MRRIQIHIDEDTDDALAAEAHRLHLSKAALIRRYVADRLPRQRRKDPLDDLMGSIDAESAPVDDVVYR